MYALPLLLSLFGCGGPAETPAPEPAEAPAPAPEAKPDAPDPGAAWKVLAPSPLELEEQVREAGISASMADLVPTTVPEEVYGEVEDQVALHTGVLFAHTLLGGRTSEKGVFLTQVRGVRHGMEAVHLGEGSLKQMDRAIEQIQNDTASRDDFLVQLDNHVSMSVPEEGWGPGDETGPLLQAGAWLAGINTVAKAVVRADNAEAADKLLKRPDVADFFLKYIESGEGSAKAGSVSKAVAKGMKQLKEISSRDTIGIDGAKEAIEVTDNLLKLL